jgi:hypothetical protein
MQTHRLASLALVTLISTACTPSRVNHDDHRGFFRLEAPDGSSPASGDAGRDGSSGDGSSGDGLDLVDYPIPESDDFTFYAQGETADGETDSWTRVTAVRAPPGAEIDPGYWIGVPEMIGDTPYPTREDPARAELLSTAPIPAPAVPRNLYMEYAGSWNRVNRMRFYGREYTAMSTLIIGDPQFLVMNLLPNFGWSSRLSWDELRAIADTCRGVTNADGHTSGPGIVCAATNCRNAETARGGACRQIAQCTVQTLRLMGYQASARYFSVNFTMGHAVVDVRHSGHWVVVDPTWDPARFWAL